MPVLFSSSSYLLKNTRQLEHYVDGAMHSLQVVVCLCIVALLTLNEFVSAKMTFI